MRQLHNDFVRSLKKQELPHQGGPEPGRSLLLQRGPAVVGVGGVRPNGVRSFRDRGVEGRGRQEVGRRRGPGGLQPQRRPDHGPGAGPLRPVQGRALGAAQPGVRSGALAAGRREDRGRHGAGRSRRRLQGRPAASAIAKWSPPGELVKAWKDHDDLANGSPPPAAYTPPHGASMRRRCCVTSSCCAPIQAARRPRPCARRSTSCTTRSAPPDGSTAIRWPARWPRRRRSAGRRRRMTSSCSRPISIGYGAIRRRRRTSSRGCWPTLPNCPMPRRRRRNDWRSG